jgi:hypothetical protein
VGQARLPVRKIREVLRLKAEGFSDRQIAIAIGSARSTVQECARRARDAGITWPLAPGTDEAALHAMLYKRVMPLSRAPRPDFACTHARDADFHMGKMDRSLPRTRTTSEIGRQNRAGF